MSKQKDKQKADTKAKCTHTNFKVMNIGSFRFAVCSDCGFQWKL